MGKYNDNFDYENAKRDIREAGGDPDYLSHSNPAKRHDANSIWDNTCHELVLKCLQLIRSGDLESPYQIYKNYTVQPGKIL